MAIKFNFVESFPVGSGEIGFESDGYIGASDLSKVGAADPVGQAISQSRNPVKFFEKLHASIAGDKSHVGYGEACNDQGIMIEEDGILAFFYTSNEEFEYKMSFEEFAPILEAWEKAWAALQVYKARARTN